MAGNPDTGHNGGPNGTDPPGGTPPVPPGPGPGPSSLTRRILRLPGAAARWCRHHGPETLVGALLIAALSTGVPILAQQVWPSDPPAPTATPTAQPTSCSGASCSNIDPKKRGCNSDVVSLVDVHHDVRHGVRLDIRYSPHCQAAWARIREATVGDGVRISTADGHAAAADVATYFDVYTPMVPATGAFHLTACAEPDDADGTPAWTPFCAQATQRDVAAATSSAPPSPGQPSGSY